MDRREMLGVLGATAAGLAAVTGRTVLAQDAHTKHAGGHSGVHEDCLRACSDCLVDCNKTAHHCFELVAAGKKEHAKALHLTVDCEEFCGMSLKLVARSSPLISTACEACAKACDECAAECEKFSTDPQMQACAKSCRDCAKSCRVMVKAVVRAN